MKAKKSIIGFLLVACIAISTSQIVAPANAAPAKAGAKCAQIGVLQTVGSKKYTCIKVGKKIVWDKGSNLLTLDTMTPSTIRKAAYAEFNQGTLLPKAFSTNVVVEVGPSANKTHALAEVKSLKKAIKFWGDIFQPAKLTAFYVAEGDVDWIDDALCKRANYCGQKYGKWSDQIRRGISDGACTSGQAILSDDNAPIFIQCIGKHSADPQNKQTTPHEYTHNVQQLASNIDSSPRWLSEGSAVLFGAYVALHKNASIPTDLKYFLEFDKNSFLTRQDICDVSSLSIPEVVKCFTSSDLQKNPLPREKLSMLNSISYYPGAVATEALVAVYGLSKFKQFTTDLKTQELTTAFANNFNISLDVFYEKISKYLVRFVLS